MVGSYGSRGLVGRCMLGGVAWLGAWLAGGVLTLAHAADIGRQCTTLNSLMLDPVAVTPSGAVVRLGTPDGFTGRLHVLTSTNIGERCWTLACTTNISGGGVLEWTDTAATGIASRARFYELWNADSDGDGDGVSDCSEARFLGTRGDHPDSDGDGISDGEEVAEGSDPADGASGIPPDPALVAPTQAVGVISTFSDANGFLADADGTPVRAVTESAIEEERMAVIRGRVLDTDGDALPGVHVSILDRAEFGWTRSRLDGCYDLILNGGGPVCVVYSRYDRLTAHRSMDVPWQQVVVAPDVRLVAVDTNVTAVMLGETGVVHAARGSVGSDRDGVRRPTVVIPADVVATVVRHNGETQIVSQLDVRLTEFTVGPNGPEAMPAPLPPTAGYTHCVELSVDGAREVYFDKPVYYYLENFLGFAVGAIVPQGHYDMDKGVWEPTPDGIVLGVVAVDTEGRAEVDTDGDGLADTADAMAALGITEAERRTIAAMYAPGVSVWRVPVLHFSRKDHNWPVIAEAGAANPGNPPPTEGKTEGGVTVETGGAIDVENQRFLESLPVVGCPFALHYASDRGPGRGARLRIPVTGDSLPGTILDIVVEVSIAGRLFRTNFAASTNLTYVHHWDGRDMYGRVLNGRQWASVRIGYVYQGYYGDVTPVLPPTASANEPADGSAAAQPELPPGAFGRPSGTIAPGVIATREYITRWQQSLVPLGSIDARHIFGLGGWSIGIHHAYDSQGNILHYGTGEDRSIRSSPYAATVETVAGSGVQDYLGSGDGGDARQATLYEPVSVSAAPDGSFYIADTFNNRIRRVSRAGIITTVAGSGLAGCYGDGGPATNAWLNRPQGVSVGPDGSVYIADTLNNRIRAIRPDGTIVTIAGTGGVGYSGDGVAATNATLWGPRAVAASAEGEVYIADSDNYRVRCVGADGIIRTVAGGGSGGLDAPAVEACIDFPCGVAVAPDGRVFIAETASHRVSCVYPDGIVRRVAGDGSRGYGGNGGPATNGPTDSPSGIAVAPDGTLYITDRANCRIRRVTADGIGLCVAGLGPAAYGGDGDTALRASFNWPQGVAVTPDGKLLIADTLNNRIRRVSLPVDSYRSEAMAFPSEDASVVYCFDANGRHLTTRHALTWQPLFTFGYTSQGMLDRVTDVGGLVTTVERTPEGAVAAIRGPYGHRTRLTTNADGWLTELVNPAMETNRMGYSETGLLTNIVSRRGHDFVTVYGDDGAVAGTRDPVGGSNAVTMTIAAREAVVTHVTGMGRTNLTSVATGNDGTFTRLATDPSGLTVQHVRTSTGQSRTTLPDGTTIVTEVAPDPRFGMLAPYASQRILRLPEGRQFVETATRTATLTVAGDPSSLVVATNRYAREGRTGEVVYVAAERKTIATTPGGRSSWALHDEAGRPLVSQAPGRFAVSNRYDGVGRLVETIQGDGPATRRAAFGYDTNGVLVAVTNALGQVVRFEADMAGRVTNAIGDDGTAIAIARDRSDAPVWYRLSHGQEHRFEEDAVGLPVSYTPPPAADATGSVMYAHNLDRQSVSATTPGGVTVTNHYDSAGRVTSVWAMTADATNTVTYGYDAAGRLVEATRDGVALRFGHDGVLPVSQRWFDDAGQGTRYEFDDSLRLDFIAVGGIPVRRRYDDDGLLQGVGALELRRDAETGFVTDIVVGCVTQHLWYTGFGEVAGTRVDVAGSTVFETGYLFDALGRVTNLVESSDVGALAYDYVFDRRGRLTGVGCNGAEHAGYAYDANGNRTTGAVGGVTCVGVYDAQDRQLSYGEMANEWSADGALTNRTGADGSMALRYDGFGDLREVEREDGTRIAYTVDALGRRVEKWRNGELAARWTYRDALNPIAEWNRFGYMDKRFVYADHPFVPSYMVQGSAVYRLVSDHLGSVRMVIDSQTGEVVQRLDYDAFGVIVRDTNPGFQPFGFHGGLYDADTGLVKFGARDYDPHTGRWLTKDPILLAGGPNVYAFCHNDPVNFVDPWGRWGTDVHFEKTQEWLRQIPGVGDVVALEVAAYNEDTDRLSGGFGPWGAKTGDSSRHFDYYDGPSDSRLVHAKTSLAMALILYRDGKRDAALQVLGQGLHSIQDYHAHRDWDPRTVAFDWKAHPAWYDDIRDPRNRIALDETRKATIEYVTQFMEACRK